MRRSNFSDEEKARILQEKELTNKTIAEICENYGISIPTFYQWKKKIKLSSFELESDTNNETTSSLAQQNRTLRQLYIGLSEHNYKLAQFLSK